MTTNEQEILVTAALILTATGFFGGAGFSLFRTRLFLRGARRTIGVVIGNTVAKNSDGGDTYVPVVRFQTDGNDERQITGTIGSNPPAYRAGDRVKIGYPPRRPHDARILTFFGLYWLPLIFSVFGAAATFAAAVVFFSGIN